MNGHSAAATLTAHLAMLSSISFGGFASILPAVRDLAVTTHGWVTDQEFDNFFALSQCVPGPSMILMMSFIGWKVGGIPGAIVSALATFGPPCVMYFSAYRLWDRFRAAPWQRIVRDALVPVTVGLIIAGGTVMARTADAGWPAICVTAGAALLMLGRRSNPFLIILAGGVLGGLGLI